MKKHSILPPSGSHRWLNCTPSARLEQEFDDKESEAAKEGTAAHALCEHKLKKALRMRSRRPVSDYDSDEMEECSDAYVDFIMEQVEAAKQHCNDPIVLIEQHLDFSCYVPDGYGTGDCIIISDEKLHIVDFKAKFEEVIGGLIYKPPGKPTLVPDTDKRPAMNVTNAINEFNEIKEEM